MNHRSGHPPAPAPYDARTRHLPAALLALALLFAPSPAAALVPDDPLFDRLWGLQNTGQLITDVNGGQSVGTPGADIGAPAAWDLTTGSPDVVLAVIDTGIDYLHEDLAASMWRNPGEVAGDGIDNDGNGWADDVHGIDVVDRDADPMDDWWHGTHVAGTTAAALGNGAGVTGVAPGARLMALRAFSYPSAAAPFEGTVEGVIACLRYAIDMKTNRGVNVVAVEMAWWWNENSYSGVTGRWFEFRDGDILSQAIEEAGAAGIIVVTAEGNYALNNDIRPPAQLSYPATYTLPNVIGVAASDAVDRPAHFSSWGPATADLFAPGDSTLSTVKTGCLFPPYTGDPMDYAVFPGTGTAVPHVAGAVALMASLYPEEGVTARVNRLLHGVDRLHAYEGLSAANGRLNLPKALAEDVPPLITGLTPPDGHRAGDVVTVTGANFGSTPGRVVLSREQGSDYRTESFVFRFLVRHAFWRDVADVYLDDVRLGTTDEVLFEDGLEAGAGAWVWGGDDWSPEGMPDAWGATDAAAHGGTGSLRTREWLASDFDEHRLWARNAAPVDLSGTRGREVRLSFWARTLQTRFDDVSLWFSADGGATWEQVAVIPQIGPAAGWYRYEFTVPGAPVEAVEAEVVSWSSDAATIRLPQGALRNLTVVTAAGTPSSNRGVVSSWTRKATTAVLGHPGSFDAVHLGGRIYAVGSWPDATGNNSAPGVVSYDPATDTWGKPERRGVPDIGTSSATACGGRIYIPASAPGVGSWLRIHDPIANTWAMSSIQPELLSEGSVVCLDGAVWIAGGNDPLAAGGSRRLFRYDIAADRWDRMADMGRRRSAFAAVAARGKIYAFGGRDRWNSFLGSAEVYDPRHDEWTALPDLPGGLRGKPAAASDGRRIYVVGGQDYNTLPGTSSTQVYDVVEGRWVDGGGTAADQTNASLDSALVYVPGWGLYNLGGARGEPRTPRDRYTLFGAIVRALPRNERLDSDRIYPQVTVLGPDGGERFPSGSQAQIHWGAPPEAARFTVEYSPDGGAAWTTVAENVTSTAIPWQAPIPGANPVDCLVRVTAFDAAGNLLGTDLSDAPFRVEVVRLLRPVSGTSLIAGDEHTIRWRTGITRRAVFRTTVMLSQDWGVTWKRVAALAGNPGRLHWTVPLPQDGDLIGRGRLRIILRDFRGRVIGRAEHDREFAIYLPPRDR